MRSLAFITTSTSTTIPNPRKSPSAAHHSLAFRHRRERSELVIPPPDALDAARRAMSTLDGRRPIPPDALRSPCPCKQCRGIIWHSATIRRNHARRDAEQARVAAFRRRQDNNAIPQRGLTIPPPVNPLERLSQQEDNPLDAFREPWDAENPSSPARAQSTPPPAYKQEQDFEIEIPPSPPRSDWSEDDEPQTLRAAIIA